eukprot:1180825-Prorocentrum_minimum.AAC.1
MVVRPLIQILDRQMTADMEIRPQSPVRGGAGGGAVFEYHRGSQARGDPARPCVQGQELEAAGCALLGHPAGNNSKRWRYVNNPSQHKGNIL